MKAEDYFKLVLLCSVLVFTAVLSFLPIAAWILPLPAVAALIFVLYFVGDTKAGATGDTANLSSLDILPSCHELEALVVRQAKAAATEVDSVQHILNDAITNLAANFTVIANAAREQQAIATGVLSSNDDFGADRLIAETASTLTAISQLMQDNHATAERLTAEMVSMSTQISDMVSQLSGLDDIAKKIHFLSLNANIEAARAGEAGRGFVVVAEEVHKLAQYTRSFSDGIRARIGQVRTSIDSMGNAASELSQRQDLETERIRHHVDETLVDLRKLHEGQSGALNALSGIAFNTEESILGATTALQFQDMSNQLLQHARRRIEALKLAAEATRECQTKVKQGDREALETLRQTLSSQERALSHNPVAQNGLIESKVELF